MSSHYLSLAWLIPKGYNLFTFDYRGYGQSEGSPSQKGLYHDALAALEQAWRYHVDSKALRFVVYGQSLGGAVAMRALPDWPGHDHVDLLVLDSTFLSYKEVASRLLASRWLTWIFQPLPYLLVSDEYSAAAALSENRRPLLIIHDRDDPIVPFACGVEILERASQPKEFWELRNGIHIGVFSEEHPSSPTTDYRARFIQVLERAEK